MGSREQSGIGDVLTYPFGDSLTIDPYCGVFPLATGVPVTRGVASKGDGDLTETDSPLRPRTDISTILNHDMSIPW